MFDVYVGPKTLPPRKQKNRPRTFLPASQRDPNIRTSIEGYLESLIELYKSTDPALGAVSEIDKLENARRAIGVWWYLYGEIVLWAQSQITGYEFGRSNPEFIEKLSKIFGHNITVDSHLLEYIGLMYSWNRFNYDDPMAQRVEDAMEKYNRQNVGLDERAIRSLIRELLVSRSANSSFWRFELQSALYALNLGHAEDIVTPEPVRRQGDPVRVLYWKVRALEHVYFNIGKGIKKYRALQLVADVLGQSTETLRSWEKFALADEDSWMNLNAAKIAGELEDELNKLSVTDLIKKYGAEYHRGATDIEYARFTLQRLRSTTLEEIRDGLRNSRRPKKSGS